MDTRSSHAWWDREKLKDAPYNGRVERWSAGGVNLYVVRTGQRARNGKRARRFLSSPEAARTLLLVLLANRTHNKAEKHCSGRIQGGENGGADVAAGYLGKKVKRERLWESPYYGRVTRCTSEEGIWYLVQVSRSQRRVLSTPEAAAALLQVLAAHQAAEIEDACRACGQRLSKKGSKLGKRKRVCLASIGAGDSSQTYEADKTEAAVKRSRA